MCTLTQLEVIQLLKPVPSLFSRLKEEGFIGTVNRETFISIIIRNPNHKANSSPSLRRLLALLIQRCDV